MKAMILDPATAQIVSAVYSQTQILEQEVYLVELLGKRHEKMMHLKAAIFIQPTEANLVLLAKELKDPKFAEYHIFFSNIVPADMLTKLGKYFLSYLLSFCVCFNIFFMLMPKNFKDEQTNSK